MGEAFNAAALCSPQTLAGGYPNNLGFGNLGRNVLRGSVQRRADISLSKEFTIGRPDSKCGGTSSTCSTP